MKLVFNPLAEEFQLAPDTASEIRIQDAGGLYDTETVETALQEIALRVIHRPKGVLSIGTPANGLTILGTVLSLALASSGVTGALSGTDWDTFNGKQNPLTFPLSPTLGGTGVNNGTNALTVPATGTAALLATTNLFTGINSFTRGTDSTNLFLGGAGNTTTTGVRNIAIGTNVLTALTDGIRNTAIGYDTLKVNTTGVNNVAIGDAAMLSNVDGYYNLAIGVQALKENVSGFNNVAIGLDALQYNLASNNVALGFQAANKNTSGAFNMAIGTTAMFTNTTGLNNVAIGYNALYLNNTTNQNIAIGSQALENNIANSNIGIGYYAGQALTSGTPNIAIGTNALDACQTAGFNVAIGSGTAGKTTGGFNTAIGAGALANNVAGIANVAIGVSSMVTGSGSRNIMLGSNSGFYETGSDKLFIDNASRTSEAIARETSFLVGNMAAGGLLQLNIGTTTTNAVKEAFRTQSYVSTASTGSANGFGVGHSFYAETATDGTYQQQGLISTAWVDATNATRKALLTLSAFDTAQRDGIKLEANGASADIRLLGDTWFEGEGFGLPYGSFYGNDIGWTQAGAVQNTWYEIADADIADGQLNLVTHDGNGKLTVAKAGRYLINYHLTASCSVAGKELQAAISVSGTEQNDGIDHEIVTNANAKEGLASTAILDLAANATIEISLRTTDAGTPDISVEHINVSITQIGGT